MKKKNAMKKIFSLIAAMLLALPVTSAQTTSMVIDRAIEALTAAGGITATYTLTGDNGTISGRVAMRGNCFAMLADEAKCWFDGKTQWAYSAVTGEVNITEPTAAELQLTNPIATLRAAKTEFIVTRGDARQPGIVTLRLTPKQRTNVRNVQLSFDNKTSLPVSAVIMTADGQTATLTISNLKTGQRLPASAFTFDKQMVPAGTPVVDLR